MHMKHLSLVLLALVAVGTLPLEAAGFNLKEVKLKHGISAKYPDMLKVDDAKMLQEVSDIAKKELNSGEHADVINPDEFGVLFMATKQAGDKMYMEQVLVIQGVLAQEQLKAIGATEKQQMGMTMMQQMCANTGTKPVGFVKAMPPDVKEANGLYYFQVGYDVVDQANNKQSVFQGVYYTKKKTVIIQMILPTSFAHGHLNDIQQVLASVKMAD